MGSLEAIISYLIRGNMTFPHLHIILGHRAEIHVSPGTFHNPQAAAELFEQAAEQATASLKGKAAAIYYEKAELAWSLVQ